MPTEKRHMYIAGTVNVETGNIVVKQDINYYSANPQSATRSIIRMIEDSDRRFSQNQIYDGLTISNGGATVDVASGTAKIGGRWVTVVASNLSAAVADGDWNIVLHVSGVSETNSRDPSGGESVNLFLEASGSWVDDDLRLALGSANIVSSTVTSVDDRAKRKINSNVILPYGTSTQVSIYTGTKPIYREAIRFATNSILPYNKIVSNYPISGTAISGSSLNISGDIEGQIISGSSIYSSGLLDVDGNITTGGTLQVSGTSSEVIDLSGSALSAITYQIGSKVLSQSEFDNIDGLDQPLDTTRSPSFVQVISTQDNTLPPFIVASTGTVVNLNADRLDGQDAPSSTIVGISDTQILTNKQITTPIILSLYQDVGKTKLMTLPNTASDTLVAVAASQTLTSKTILGGNLSGSIGFSAGSIGNVSSTEFEYVNGVTGYIQTQLNGKSNTSHAHGSSFVYNPHFLDNGTGGITSSVGQCYLGNSLNFISFHLPTMDHGSFTSILTTIKMRADPVDADLNIDCRLYNYIDGVKTIVSTQTDSLQGTAAGEYVFSFNTTINNNYNYIFELQLQESGDEERVYIFNIETSFTSIIS